MNKDKQFNFHKIRGEIPFRRSSKKEKGREKGEKKREGREGREERIYVQTQGEDHPLGLNVEQKLWCRYSNHL